jgi:hypothetical protein
VVCHCVWSRNIKNEEAKTRKWVVKASKRRIRRYVYRGISSFNLNTRWGYVVNATFRPLYLPGKKPGTIV